MKATFQLQQKHLFALTLVGTWGYLTTRELALLCWPQITPKAALKAAQLACKSLEADGYLLARDLDIANAGKAYVLTHKAARFLCDHWTSLAFRDGYDLQLNRQQMRRPVIDLAHVWAKEKSLYAVGPRGLAADVWGLGAFKSLDALLVDPDALSPAFGILLVRTYDPQTVARVKAACRLPVPVMLAGAEAHARAVDALAKVRAEVAPEHDEHLLFNLPGGTLRC